MYWKSCVANVLLCLAFLMTGCRNIDVVPTATIPVPTSGPTSLTYVVQRGRVVKELEFNGRISPVEEVSLYFKTPGYVKHVYVKQGDLVKVGDLLAELETDDLLNQRAQAEVALNSAQLLLSEAEKSLDRQITQAELDLVVAQTRLAQAEDANDYAITQAELSLMLAREQLLRLTQTEGTNAHVISQAGLALALAREQLTRTHSLQATYTADMVRARVGLERAENQVARAETDYKEALDRSWEPQDVRDDYALALQQTQWNLEVIQAEYDEALANMEVYQRDLKIREIVVKQAEKGVDSFMQVHQSDLKIQEIVVKQAEVELEQLKKGVDPLLALEVQRAQQELDRLEEGVDPVLVNDVNQAQLAVERLQGHVANAQVVAPVDGEVVTLSLYPGHPVEAFKTVIVIADPSAIEVSAGISSEQLKDLTEGQKATVVSSTDPGRIWTGTVLRLPYPYASGDSAKHPASSDQSVRVSLEGDVSDLKLGYLVHVTVVLEEKDDALWLPPMAIHTLQGRTFVTVQDGGRQRRADVELGIEGQNRVEILRGLEEGQVIVAP